MRTLASYYYDYHGGVWGVRVFGLRKSPATVGAAGQEGSTLSVSFSFRLFLSLLTKVRIQGGRAAPYDLWIPAVAGKEEHVEMGGGRYPIFRGSGLCPEHLKMRVEVTSTTKLEVYQCVKPHPLPSC